MLIALIWIVDIKTGYEVSFSIFYLIPIALVTWYGGRVLGILTALVSATAWLLADLKGGHQYSSLFIPYWNASVRLGFFMITTFSLFYIRKLLEHLEQERDLARTDSLTGLMNMRYFEELAGMELERSRRYQRPLTMVYLDCDDFKLVNDRSGHQAGSELLHLIAQIIRKNLRSVDLLGRFGGDEFIILLPETAAEAGREMIKRLQARLLEAVQSMKQSVTFSIGVATFLKPPDSLEEMIRTADRIMYQVKGRGKNRIQQETY